MFGQVQQVPQTSIFNGTASNRPAKWGDASALQNLLKSTADDSNVIPHRERMLIRQLAEARERENTINEELAASKKALHEIQRRLDDKEEQCSLLEATVQMWKLRLEEESIVLHRTQVVSEAILESTRERSERKLEVGVRMLSRSKQQSKQHLRQGVVKLQQLRACMNLVIRAWRSTRLQLNEARNMAAEDCRIPHLLKQREWANKCWKEEKLRRLMVEDVTQAEATTLRRKCDRLSLDIEQLSTKLAVTKVESGFALAERQEEIDALTGRYAGAGGAGGGINGGASGGISGGASGSSVAKRASNGTPGSNSSWLFEYATATAISPFAQARGRVRKTISSASPRPSGSPSSLMCRFSRAKSDSKCSLPMTAWHMHETRASFDGSNNDNSYDGNGTTENAIFTYFGPKEHIILTGRNGEEEIKQEDGDRDMKEGAPIQRDILSPSQTLHQYLQMHSDWIGGSIDLLRYDRKKCNSNIDSIHGIGGAKNIYTCIRAQG